MTTVELAAAYKKEAHHYHWFHSESESFGNVSEVAGWAYNDIQDTHIEFKLENGRVAKAVLSAIGKYGEAVEVTLNNSFRCLGIRKWIDTIGKTYWEMTYGFDRDHRYQLVVVRK
jgi:hypothetical protein